MRLTEQLPQEQQDKLLYTQTEPTKLQAIAASALMNFELPPRADVIGGILPKNGLAMLAGLFKSGKTIFALGAALQAARGNNYLEFKMAQSRILLLSGEGGPQLLKERLAKMIGDDHTGLENLFFWWPTESRLDLSLKESREHLARLCIENKIDLVIVDPLIRFNSLDENSTKEMGDFVNGLHELRQAADVAILLVHHTRKPGKGSGNTGSEARGSSVLAGEVDSLLLLQNRRASNDFTLHFELRWAEEPSPLRLQLNKETLLFESLGDLEGKRKLSSKQLYGLMQEAGPSTVAELVKLTDTSKKTVRTYLKELDEQGLAGFEIQDKGRKVWHYLPKSGW